MQNIYLNVPTPNPVYVSLVNGTIGPTEKVITLTDSDFNNSGGSLSWEADNVQAAYTVMAYKATSAGVVKEETPSFSYSGKDESGELLLPAGEYYLIKAKCDTEGGAMLKRIYTHRNPPDIQNIYINVPEGKDLQGIYFSVPDAN